MNPIYMIGCVNEIGEKQKADNISGLLGEAGFREYINEPIPNWKRVFFCESELIILKRSMIIPEWNMAILY